MGGGPTPFAGASLLPGPGAAAAAAAPPVGPQTDCICRRCRYWASGVDSWISTRTCRGWGETWGSG